MRVRINKNLLSIIVLFFELDLVDVAECYEAPIEGGYDSDLTQLSFKRIRRIVILHCIQFETIRL